MSRIERIGDATLYLGDGLDHILDGYDALITDPPYGIDRGDSGHKVVERLGGVINDDTPFDPAPLFGYCAHQIIWGANHFSSRLPDDRRRWLMWLKHDPIMFGKRSTAPFELAWCSVIGADRAFKLIWDGSIKQGEGAGRAHVHPAEKPVELMEWCIEQLPAVCDSIFDPFMGSGTTGVAALRRGRRFIGVEIDPVYFDIACERLQRALREPNLL